MSFVQPEVRLAGKADSLWDVWFSPAAVRSPGGWAGFVEREGESYFTDDGLAAHTGPFSTRDEAVEALVKLRHERNLR